MRTLKSHVLLRLVNSYIVDSPQPANLSYLWNFGSLLGTCLILQILTGIFLAMHYQPHVDFAFNSVEHIMRDVNNGWAVRYTHANVASFFFIFVYAHIARGLYYGSYKSPRVLLWAIGVIILIVMMATAFLGYIKHSPKWSKFNSNSKNLLRFNNKNKKYKNIYLIQKRNYSNYPSNYSPVSPTSIIDSRLPHLTVCGVKPSSSMAEDQAVAYKEGSNGQGFTNSKPTSLILSNFIKEKELTPVNSYENLQLDETRKQILIETKGISGIYLILNKVTLDYYIGSAATDRFYARFSNHLIYFRGSKIVKNAVKKYKLSNFAFLILELFLDNGGIVNKENNKQLLNLEDFYLKSLLPNYNILTEAGSSFGYKHTEIDRIKMKSNYSLERRLKIGNLNKGKKLSPETIKKMSEKALCRDRSKINLSAQSILNMKKNSKPVILLNLDYTVFGEYNSITDAAFAINCNVKTIRRALQTEKKQLLRKFIVKYLNN